MELIGTFLQLLASFMISPEIPVHSVGSDWFDSVPWKQNTTGALEFSSFSKSLPEKCKRSPESTLVSPLVLQGVQVFLLDGLEIHRTGDPDLRTPSSIYNVATVPCQKIKNGAVLTWKVFTATHSLAVLHSSPVLKKSTPIKAFFSRPALPMVAGALLGIALFCSLSFYRKVPDTQVRTLMLLSLSFATCFLFTVPDLFLLHISPLTCQKISDGSLWIGVALVFQLLRHLGHCTKIISLAVSIVCAISFLTIVISSNLDQIQVGSNFGIVGNVAMLVATTTSSLLKNYQSLLLDRSRRLEILIVLIFVGASVNDLLIFLAGFNSMPLFPFGALANVALLALAVNKQIVRTYEERDHLRENLEIEVKNKTKELEATVYSLKEAQADLVQSAKLASVGTLATGIAHEINNSLNYVNGSLFPLSKWVDALPLEVEKKKKPLSLIKIMKEGLALTFDIIKNLKYQTRTQSDQPDYWSLKEIAEGTIVILTSALKEIEVKVDIDSVIEIKTLRPSLSQILLNLIGNAAEAIGERPDKEKQGLIRVSAKLAGENTELSISDNGPGIPQELIDRIYDPFFTTKTVDKGTGLGLYIVRSEVTRLGANIEIKTNSSGTTFKLTLPPVEKVEEAA